ncbi:MAG: hypothetical protein C0514_07130 [Candidatus Puniceispirillum sp.]|nr:hypothetical protein [Candidatus Puniceispirillum sp.]
MIHIPWLLSRYFAARFLRWFGVACVTVLALIYLFDLSEMARRASSNTSVGLLLLVRISLLRLPSLFEKLLPFVVLFSTMVTLWSLNRKHELEVTKACGISIWQILRPLLLVVAGVACLDLILVNPFGARMMLEYERLESTYLSSRQGALAISDTGLWARERVGETQSVIHVKSLSPADHSLVTVSVTHMNAKDAFVARFDATSATFEPRHLVLYNVWKTQGEEIPTFFRVLKLPTTFTYASLQESGVDPRSLSFWQLPHFSKLLSKSGLSPLKYELHQHTLLARLLWLCVMVFLAAACSLRPLRQGGTLMLAASGLVVSFLLYFASDVCQTLGASGKLPVLLAAWGPATMSALAGISVLLYSEDG